jgi:hypothetical protein
MYEAPSHSHRNRLIALTAVAGALVIAVVLALVLSGGNRAKAGQAQQTLPPASPSAPLSNGAPTGGALTSGVLSNGAVVTSSGSAHSHGASSPDTGVGATPATRTSPATHTTSPATHTTSPAAPGPLHVSVSLAGPVAYRGWCPVRMMYAATITVDHTPADLTYHWNDGTASAGAPTLHVTHSPVTITRTIDPADSTTGSLSLDVLSPVSASSNVAHFSVMCQSVAVGTATVSPASYTGDCSRGITFTFTGTVSVTNGPLDLEYRWTRSDGSTGPTESLSFGPGSSTQAVHDTWRLGGSHGSQTFSEQLQVLGDHGTSSNPASFTIWCV